MTDRKPTPEELIAQWEAASDAWASDFDDIGNAMSAAGCALASALEQSLAREQRLREALVGLFEEERCVCGQFRDGHEADEMHDDFAPQQIGCWAKARAALEDSDGE